MNNLNKKWWFRLVVVIYVLISIVGLYIIILEIIDKIPRLNLYQSTLEYTCNDGYSGGNFTYGLSGQIESDSPYSVKKNTHFYFKDSSWVRLTKEICNNTNNIRELDNDSFKTVAYNIFLENGRSKEYISKTPIEDNYKLNIKEANYHGSWKGMIISSTIQIVIFLVIILTIRYVFFYVITGKHKFIFNEKIRNK